MSITVIVSFKVKPDLVAPFISLLESIQNDMVQSGARSVTLFKDIEFPHKIVEVEKWDSKEDHQNFAGIIATTPKFKEFQHFLLEPYKVQYLDPLSQQEAFC